MDTNNDGLWTMYLRLQLGSFWVSICEISGGGVSLFHFSESPGDLAFFHLMLMPPQISKSHENLVSIYKQNNRT